jgi:hypothetical protein
MTKGSNCSFIVIQFYITIKAPSVYKVSIKLQDLTVLNIREIICKEEVAGIMNG